MSRLAAGKLSTVTKSSLGSIRWATVLISSHPVMCNTQMWPVNTPSKHETLTQCWSNSVSPSATLAQHKTSTGSTPRVCRAAGLAAQADTDPMSVKCWASVAGAGQYPFNRSQQAYFMLAVLPARCFETKLG